MSSVADSNCFASFVSIRATYDSPHQVSQRKDTLTQELRVHNTDPTQSLSFTTALHTYFTVSDLPSVEISGLQGLRYDDNARNGAS